MEILLLDFHFSSRSPPGLWECGNRALAISKGGGKRWKTCFWFSSFSMARHFHSLFALALHALRLSCSRANSFFFSFCILCAAAVSLISAAISFSPITVNSSFK